MKYWIAAIAAAAASPALAMPATTFLAKADALTAKGPLAMFSGDLGVLKAEFKSASGELRSERLALAAQHRPTAYCPPAKSSLNTNELIASMHRIPPAELARMQFKDALRLFLKQKYPCPR